MRLAVVVVVFAFTGACKKKQDAAPGPGSASGSAAQVASDASVAAGTTAPASGLAFEPSGDESSALGTAFHDRLPKLPAMSPDDRSIATFEWLGGEPMVPQPVQLSISESPSGDVIESLPLLTEDEAMAAGQAGDAWMTPDLQKRLEQRGAAALKRLQGFRSLVKLDLSDLQPTKIDDLTLVSGSSDDGKLVITLNDATGGALYHEEVAGYTSGDCWGRPAIDGAYRDPSKAMLYVAIEFRFRDACETSRPHYLAWNIDAGVRELRTLVTTQLDVVGMNDVEPDQLFTDNALITSANFVASTGDIKLIGVAANAMDYSRHDDKDVSIIVSRDGKSAWASELASVSILEPNTPGKDVPWRVSDVLVKTPKGWRISAAAWTEPRKNADVNRAAKSGKLVAQKLDGESNDPTLRAAFEKLTTDGVDANAAARTDLVALGSGPGERTVGGASFAKAWNAAWKGKVSIVSTVAHAMPSGTTGWVAATIELAKTGYKIPFTVFCVFDKAADGSWSLVHIHFAV